MADEGKDANAEFAMTKHRCAKIYQPGDHRWMIEIANVEVSGVEPIVGFLGEKVRPGQGGQLEQE